MHPGMSTTDIARDLKLSPKRFARLTQRDLRLASGVVLFAYVVSHLTNHALGLISMASAQHGLDIAVRVWQSLPGTLLLYGAAAIHLTLAFAAIYARRTLRMPALDLVRIILGLGIPLLLIGHAVFTRMAYELYDAPPDYMRVVWSLWTSDGEARQLALLVPGWLHGCLGIYLAFGHRRVFQRLRFVLFAAAILLPVLAGLGFLAMGRELAMHAADRASLDAHAGIDPTQRIALDRLRDIGLGIYFAVISAVFAAREVRALIERRRDLLITVTYPQRVVRVPRGWSVLEASRSFHIPHTSVCGGRARCSTCRVRIVDGHDRCPPPGPDEQATLERIRAPADVRLACQIRPLGNISVIPLVAAGRAVLKPDRLGRGAEREIAILFVDWRNRASFGRRHLPQDVLYLAKVFTETVGSVVQATESAALDVGTESAIAIYGLREDIVTACHEAATAAAAVERGLDRLNSSLAREFGEAMDYTICLHTGHAAVADVGARDASRIMAVGEAVDDGERLRRLATETGSRLIVSEPFLRHSGIAVAEFTRLDVASDDGGPTLVAYVLSSVSAIGS
jgi:adenylate cyclase